MVTRDTEPPPTASPAPDPASPAGSGFRRDVEGLRALAVLAVLAYHARLPGFGGGYVGVDVFFVLSGYLITGLLVAERADRGGISLTRFYARRARRLLPAASLVIVVTIVAAWLAGGPLELHRAAEDGRAVALFGANIWFAGEETGYFAPRTTPSVFQHFWSLAVEQQFYLSWPLLCLALCWRAPSREAIRQRLTTFLAVLVPVSFVWCVVLTGRSQPDAFLLLPSRAWELGVGALLALAGPRLLPRRLAALVGIVGAALVVGAITLFSDTTYFPGWAAAVPVLGTAAVLLAGSADPSTPLTRVLASSPLQPIGRASYSLYLWHWPVLMVAAIAWPSVLDERPKSVLFVLLSVPLALVAYHLIEDPVRRSRWLAVPRRGLAMGGALVGICLVGALVGIALPALDSGRPAAADAGPVDFVPEDVRPSLVDAIEDRAPFYDDDCYTDRDEDRYDPCTYGDRSSDVVVTLLGDSHAGQWFTPIRELADERGWRLDVDVVTGCSLLEQSRAECDERSDDLVRRLNLAPPDVVVIGDYARGQMVDGLDARDWAKRLRSLVERLPRSRVVVIGETPRLDEDATACLVAHLSDVRPCEADPDDRVLLDIQARSREVTSELGAGYLDPMPLLCDGGRCPIIVGDRIVHTDDHHLSETFVRWISERFGRELEAAIPADLAPATLRPWSDRSGHGAARPRVVGAARARRCTAAPCASSDGCRTRCGV